MTSRPSFNPLELLGVAESIAERDSSEASLRTAVNRTYYGVMLAVREELGVAGGRHSHIRIIQALRERDRRAGDQLRRLMHLRVLADYDLDVQDPLRTDWRYNYRLARSFADFILGRMA